jgi:pSer/pThr/pTyr-binding forkhead associated (FHA) protein
MRICLSLHRHTDQTEEVVVDRFPFVIGRSPDADITLDDRWVSRRHCELEMIDGLLFVRDLGSKHGILVNDSPVSESPLQPGDTLNVGLSTVVAVYEKALIEEETGASLSP